MSSPLWEGSRYNSINHVQELLPEHILIEFFGKHEEHAKLPLKYPNATVLTDSCALHAVDAYRHTFLGSVLHDYASVYATKKGLLLSVMTM